MRKNLVSARKAKGYTQVYVAEQISITSRQYQGLEAGSSNGRVIVWEKLKQLLDAPSIDYLLVNEQ